MVHQGLVLEFSLEAARVANTIPRLDADEGRLLAERTPEGDDGGTEGDGDLRITSRSNEFCTMQLALVDLDGVVAPGVVCELHNAILCLYEWYLVHLVRAVAIAVEGVHWLLVVKTDAPVLVLASLHAWDVEGWVAAYLEVDLLGVGVMAVPDDTYLVIIKDRADAESEIVGVY